MILIAFATLFIIDVAALFALRTHAVSNAVLRRASRYYYDNMREYWGDKIAKEGGRAAYAALKETFTDGDPTISHGAAHAFGEVLFKKEGLAGLAVCDSAITFGCFHGFTVTAVAEGGIGALDEIGRGCVKAFGDMDTGCRHGVGHGILELTGAEGLGDALAYCTGIQQSGILGCAHGVFMEYMTAERKVMDRSRPDEPCASVPERFRPMCYFQLPSWWSETFHDDYAGMGTRCAARAAARERDACFLAVGRAIAEFHAFDTDVVLDGCARMPSDEARLTCRAGAYWLYGSVGKSKEAERLCASPDADWPRRCVARAGSIDDAAAWQ